MRDTQFHTYYATKILTLYFSEDSYNFKVWPMMAVIVLNDDWGRRYHGGMWLVELDILIEGGAVTV